MAENAETRSEQSVAETPTQTRVIQSIPSARDIPKFVGKLRESDPPIPEGTPETDVVQWLNLLESYFQAANINSSKHRIQQ